MQQYEKEPRSSTTGSRQPAAGFPTSGDYNDWQNYALHIGTLPQRHRDDFPDFLVVAPPKTGTTWLANTLRRHPKVLIPAEKEVRFFDAQWRQYSLAWYCTRFTRDRGQIGGDISPSYALLPGFAIRHIRLLKPDLKIIILLRDPVVRAWSHFKHTFVNLEANFACSADGEVARQADSIAEVPHDAIIRNLVDDYTLSSGDYRSIILRWLAHFPRCQIHIDFLDQIAADPMDAITRIAAFLGLESAEPFDGPWLSESVNQGTPDQIYPEIRPFLDALYRTRQWALQEFLTRDLSMAVPWPRLGPAVANDKIPIYSMDDVLGAPIELRSGWFHSRRSIHGHRVGIGSRLLNLLRPARALFLGDLQEIMQIGRRGDGETRQAFSIEDRRLIRLCNQLAERVQEPALTPELVESGPEFNVVHWRGRYLVLRKSLGPVDVRVGYKELRQRHSPHDVWAAASLEQARALVAAENPCRDQEVQETEQSSSSAS